MNYKETQLTDGNDIPLMPITTEYQVLLDNGNTLNQSLNNYDAEIDQLADEIENVNEKLGNLSNRAISIFEYGSTNYKEIIEAYHQGNTILFYVDGNYGNYKIEMASSVLEAWSPKRNNMLIFDSFSLDFLTASDELTKHRLTIYYTDDETTIVGEWKEYDSYRIAKINETLSYNVQTPTDEQITQARANLKTFIMTQEEYDALETKDPNALYYIKEG